MNNNNNNNKYDKNSFELSEKRKWGFTVFSEKINGRAAMLGFTILFLFEFLTKQKIADYLK